MISLVGGVSRISSCKKFAPVTSEDANGNWLAQNYLQSDC